MPPPLIRDPGIGKMRRLLPLSLLSPRTTLKALVLPERCPSRGWPTPRGHLRGGQRLPSPKGGQSPQLTLLFFATKLCPLRRKRLRLLWRLAAYLYPIENYVNYYGGFSGSFRCFTSRIDKIIEPKEYLETSKDENWIKRHEKWNFYLRRRHRLGSLSICVGKHTILVVNGYLKLCIILMT